MFESSCQAQNQELDSKFCTYIFFLDMIILKLLGGITRHCWNLSWLHWPGIYERRWLLPDVKSFPHHLLCSSFHANPKTGAIIFFSSNKDTFTEISTKLYKKHLHLFSYFFFISTQTWTSRVS